MFIKNDLLKRACKYSTIIPLFLLSCLFISHSLKAEVNAESYEKALFSFNNADYSSSIIHLKNILRETPKHLPSRVLMVENLLAIGNGSAAEIELSFAQKGGADSSKTTPLLAKAYLLQKKYDDVLAVFIPNHATATFQSEIHTSQGLAYIGKKELPLAIMAFNKSLALFPNATNALLGKAKVALIREDTKQAAILIEQAVKISPKNQQALLMLGIIYKLQNKIDEALTVINELLVLYPKNHTALLTRAMLSIDTGHHQAAVTDINKIIEIYPNEPIANYVKILATAALNDTSTSKQTELHLSTVLTAISDDIMTEQPIYLFLTGLMSFENNAMENAEKALTRYHKINPKDSRALKLLARSMMALGDNFSAKKHLIKARLATPNDTEIWTLLGRACMLTDDFTKSEYYFREVIKQDPLKLSALIDLAKLQLFRGQYRQTIETLETSVNTNEKNDNSAQALMIIAKAYQEINQPNQALIYSHRLLTISPEDSFSYLLHGSLQGLTRDIAGAIASYKKALLLDETNFQATIYLARIDAVQGNIDNATSRLHSYLEKGANSAIYVELGDIYNNSGSKKDALTWYQKALAYNPKSVLALTKIIESHLSNNNIKQSIELIEKYLYNFNDSPQAQQLAAELYLQNGQSQQALKSMNLAVKFSKDKGVALHKLANMQLRQGDRYSAKKSLQKAISWQSEYIPVYLMLIGLLTEDKERESSLSLIEKLSNLTTKKEIITRLTGDLFWSLGESKPAIVEYKKSLKIKATKPAIVGLYRIYHHKKQFTLITPLLKDWLAIQPNDLIIAIALGENYRYNNMLDKAAEYYQTLLIGNEKNALLLNNAAVVANEQQHYEKAATLAERAYQEMPRNVNILDTKAWIDVHRGHLNPALATLREANTLDYENAEVKYHLAVTLHKLDRNNEAINYLKEAVESQQDFYEKEQAKSLLKAWEKEQAKI